MSEDSVPRGYKDFYDGLVEWAGRINEYQSARNKEIAEKLGVSNSETPSGAFDRIVRNREAINKILEPEVMTSEFPEKVLRGREEQLIDELREWWEATSENDLVALLGKATEYGSSDLKIMARAMMAVSGPMSMQDATEMAIAFYLLGKISRLFGAYEKGRTPSDDTWHDITTYSMMGRRVRAAGSWFE